MLSSVPLESIIHFLSGNLCLSEMKIPMQGLFKKKTDSSSAFSGKVFPEAPLTFIKQPRKDKVSPGRKNPQNKKTLLIMKIFHRTENSAYRP
jgi:hypothetical protein